MFDDIELVQRELTSKLYERDIAFSVQSMTSQRIDFVAGGQFNGYITAEGIILLESGIRYDYQSVDDFIKGYRQLYNLKTKFTPEATSLANDVMEEFGLELAYNRSIVDNDGNNVAVFSDSSMQLIVRRNRKLGVYEVIYATQRDANGVKRKIWQYNFVLDKEGVFQYHMTRELWQDNLERRYEGTGLLEKEDDCYVIHSSDGDHTLYAVLVLKDEDVLWDILAADGVPLGDRKLVNISDALDLDLLIVSCHDAFEESDSVDLFGADQVTQDYESEPMHLGKALLEESDTDSAESDSEVGGVGSVESAPEESHEVSGVSEAGGVPEAAIEGDLVGPDNMGGAEGAPEAAPEESHEAEAVAEPSNKDIESSDKEFTEPEEASEPVAEPTDSAGATEVAPEQSEPVSASEAAKELESIKPAGVSDTDIEEPDAGEGVVPLESEQSVKSVELEARKMAQIINEICRPDPGESAIFSDKIDETPVKEASVTVSTSQPAEDENFESKEEISDLNVKKVYLNGEFRCLQFSKENKFYNMSGDSAAKAGLPCDNIVDTVIAVSRYGVVRTEDENKARVFAVDVSDDADECSRLVSALFD